tara:strand:- start:32 stop:319 length:288 start_codon:yes stop_codon:yes gene_type:complete
LTKNYVKVFNKFWGYGDQHKPEKCWGCEMRNPNAYHHIKGRGMGGDPEKKQDHIYNLIPLCDTCHKRTDLDRDYNEELRIKLKGIVDAELRHRNK